MLRIDFPGGSGLGVEDAHARCAKRGVAPVSTGAREQSADSEGDHRNNNGPGSFRDLCNQAAKYRGIHEGGYRLPNAVTTAPRRKEDRDQKGVPMNSSESAEHRELKRLALIWAQAHGYLIGGLRF